MKPHLSIHLISLLAATLCLLPITVFAHHFKGLPHYNYFENYPEIPEEEFLGQVGDYEVSLVVYDFQGIQRDKVDDPDMVRLFLVIFNLRNNDIYGGPLTLEVLDKGEVVHSERRKSSELENLYSMHQDLPDTGDYSLRITLHSVDDLQCTIPFTLSSQKIHWGKWVAAVMLLVITIAAIGARKARVTMDRKAEADKRKQQSESSTQNNPETQTN